MTIQKDDQPNSYMAIGNNGSRYNTIYGSSLSDALDRWFNYYYWNHNLVKPVKRSWIKRLFNQK